MKIEMSNILLLVCILGILGVCQGGSPLRTNFYKRTCPRAEAIVRNVTWQHVSTNPNLPAKLLRLYFHDCFVKGCDASVLLNLTGAEKEAIPNLSLAGFDVIDDIKAKVENECRGVVSCADIVALAARDAVSYQYRTPLWGVLTGRRDGSVSSNISALMNLPPPSFNFTQLRDIFARKNLNVRDLVVLSGAHTIGVGHCIVIRNRLYNFTGKGDQDPSLDPAYAKLLKTKCPNPNDFTTTVEMDPGSFQNFDSNYYTILLRNKGLFQSDATLLTNRQAKNTVKALVSRTNFFIQFAKSMKRMGAIEVLTGTAGEIRKQCWKVNS